MVQGRLLYSAPIMIFLGAVRIDYECSWPN